MPKKFKDITLLLFTWTAFTLACSACVSDPEKDASSKQAAQPQMPAAVDTAFLTDSLITPENSSTTEAGEGGYHMPHSEPDDPLVSDTLEETVSVPHGVEEYVIRISRIPANRVVSIGPYIIEGDTLRQYYRDDFTTVKVTRDDSLVYEKEFGIELFTGNGTLPKDNNFSFAYTRLYSVGDTLWFQHDACIPDSDVCVDTTTTFPLPVERITDRDPID